MTDKFSSAANPLRDIFGDNVDTVRPGEGVAKHVGYLRLRQRAPDGVSPLSGLPTLQFHKAAAVKHFGVFDFAPEVDKPVIFRYSAAIDNVARADSTGSIQVMPMVVEANNRDTRASERRGDVVDARDAYAMWYVEGWEIAG